MRFRRRLFDDRRRAVNLLLQPALQLKLPAFLLSITLAFGGAWTSIAYLAYRRFYETMALHRPAYLEPMIAAQHRDLLLVSTALGIAYVLVMFGVCVAFSHRMLGPGVALRRHIEALKNGDYASRVRLRPGDAFGEIADDLNELAACLEDSEKRS